MIEPNHYKIKTTNLTAFSMRLISRLFLKALFLGILTFFVLPLGAQVVSKTYSDSWGKQGFNIASTKSNGIEVIYSLKEFSINETTEKGITWHTVTTPGVFLFTDPGTPELPSSGRYIAIPKGSKANIQILDSRYETYENIEVIPSAPLPFDTDPVMADRVKSAKVYDKDAFFPAEIATISEVTEIRGFDVVMLGISPFQYNPVKKELKVLRDIKVEVTYDNGKGFYSEDRYRSPWWDQILDDVIVNFSQLPKPDYKSRYDNIKDATGFEYLIVVPDNADFLAWADTIKEFRTKQGIYTGIVTTTEIGGNTVDAITNYVANAYNTWEIPPVAILLMSDYSAPGTTTGITSPSFPHPYSGTYISDNRYADVTEDLLPEIAFARMTANDADQLEIMVKKFISYESNPPTNPSFYDNPITALGWQTERWFQICSEVVGGFWKNSLGKNPVRVNAIYQGTPGSSWSSATNTAAVVTYFGPTGRNYIPATPAELGGWSGGTPAMINTAINNGAFMLQHRDHGGEDGWGEPAYNLGSISGLTNTDLSFIMSINCLTGRFDYSSEVFAEKFHRYTYNGQASGALGLIAASQVSYSFVNDVYVWGLMDNMWPEFMEDYGNHTINRKLMPAFGNIAGKFFLAQSSWPYNTDDKDITYDLFHHHGDAFLRVYSEVPQEMAITSPDVIIYGQNSITVQAEEDAYVALSWYDEQNGESRIIAVGESTGTDMELEFSELAPVGSTVLLTATKQNCYRYTKEILVIPPDGAYVVRKSFTIDDSMGNNNGKADFGESFYINLSLENVGNENAENVVVNLTTNNEYVLSLSLAEQVEFGTIQPGQIIGSEQKFLVSLDEATPDQQSLSFELIIEDASKATYNSTVSFRANAPVFKVSQVLVDDSENGDANGRLDAGETATLSFVTQNTGHAIASAPLAQIIMDTPYLSFEEVSFTSNAINEGEAVNISFTVTAHPSIVDGTSFMGTYKIAQGFQFEMPYELIVGQLPQIVIGEGSDESEQYPFYNYYKGNRSQMLFKADEFGAGEKALMAIGFDFTTISPEEFRTLPNFVIRIKPTTLNVMPNSYVDMTDADTLVYGAAYQLASEPGWFVMETEDYTISGADNYVIDIAWGRLANWTNDYFKVNCSTYTDNLVTYGYDDNTTYPAYPTYDGSSNKRPNMQFHFVGESAGSENIVTIEAVNEVLNTPVEGAIVRIGTKDILTNTEGIAQISLFQGSYQAEISHDDYHSPEAPLDILIEGSDPSYSVSLLPFYRVNFSIINNWGSTVNDAVIEINEIPYSAGEYFFGDLVAGTYTYKVSCPHYIDTVGEFTLYDVNDVDIAVVINADGTSVVDNSLINASVYPNPTNGRFVLELGPDHKWKEVELVNSLGQIVKTVSVESMNADNTIDFNLSNNPNGLYLIRLKSDTNTAVLKIVKK